MFPLIGDAFNFLGEIGTPSHKRVSGFLFIIVLQFFVELSSVSLFLHITLFMYSLSFLLWYSISPSLIDPPIFLLVKFAVYGSC